ncbi:MAG: class I SAM-dependent methyltransferase [Halobacteriota archaeon]|nr:class I SAM-dependent methyltransferase [Halobacteriota archaeon]
MIDEKKDGNMDEYDADSYMRSLLVSNPLRESTLGEAIRTLHLPIGSRGLDVGCGIGLPTLQLAEAVGPSGHVTGLDVASDFLTCGREIVKKGGLSDRIFFQEGDMSNLPFDDDTFDWVWSSDFVGYSPMEPLPLLRELVRVVKPGGTVAILVWSSEQLLPGYPLLEARLGATSMGIAPFIKGKKPEKHFLRALGWFIELGLEEPTARAFVGSACAPLSDDLYNALKALIEMRWPGVESELEPEDLKEFQRLCKPESPDFILNLLDYYSFFTESMFWGRVPR